MELHVGMEPGGTEEIVSGWKTRERKGKKNVFLLFYFWYIFVLFKR